MKVAEPAFGVGERAMKKRDDLLFGQLLEHIDAAAREQRSIDFEGGILGGRADEPNATLFDVWQEGVLLRLVEAMNFVDEDDGARAVLAGAVGVGHDLLDFLDAGEYRGKFDELGFGNAGDDFRKRRFAGARRSPEDHRGGIIAFDLDTQRLAGTDEMFLANKLLKRAWTHAIGQRTGSLERGILRRDGGKETHRSASQKWQVKS